MEDILKKPWLSRYNNADHIAFHEVALDLCLRDAAVINAPQLIDDYNAAIQQEKVSYACVRRSDYTEKKKTVDRQRDKIFNAMKLIVRAHLNDFENDVRSDAEHVFNVFRNYANVATMSYDAATTTIESIIELLNSSDYAQAVLSLGIQRWIDHLGELNRQFKQLVVETVEEKLKKPKTTNKSARHATDVALWRIADRVNSLANINGNPPYEEFADEYNLKIKHYNTLVSEHEGRIHSGQDVSQAIVEHIPSQQYTGNPIYVIPVVSLRTPPNPDDPVRLVFMQDFSVFYRNNINPGTARLHITGIGRYKGEFVTTFNILE